MQLLIFKILDQTFGTLVRLFQRFLIRHEPRPKEPVRLINEEAMQDSADYGTKNFLEALQFRTIKREMFWDYCLSKSKALQPVSLETNKNKRFLGQGIIAEFGVFKGKSINYFAKRCPNAQVYGFDSF